MRTKRIYEDHDLWKEYVLLSRNGICREHALFGIVLTQIWLRSQTNAISLRHLVLSSCEAVLSPQSSVLGPRSSVLGPRSSILSPQSSFLSPQSSVLSPRSLGPRSSVLGPQSAILHPCIFVFFGILRYSKMTLEQWDGWKRRRANLAFLSRMSRKTQHTRFEDRILRKLANEDKPQIVPPWSKLQIIFVQNTKFNCQNPPSTPLCLAQESSFCLLGFLNLTNKSCLLDY